jgi:cytochrome b involved in lipid metabolism
MKKLATISLFIFGVVVISIMTAGLVFYQNKKDNQVAGSETGVLAQDTVDQLVASGKSLVLSMNEIGKHNKQTDCWMLINGKVYNITSYFGSHPGGNSAMLATCGKDATDAYMTKDPYAKSASGGQSHSSFAKSLLAEYYIGDLNKTIGQQAITKTNNVVAPTTRGGDDEWDD